MSGVKVLKFLAWITEQMIVLIIQIRDYRRKDRKKAMMSSFWGILI